MAFLIEEKRCTSPTSSAPVSAVIGPTAGIVINRSTRSISNESRSSERTMALSVFCRRTTVSRHSRSSEPSPSSMSGLVVSSFAKIAGLVQSLLVVAHPGFHQQRADLDFHLHHLAHQQVAVAQRAPPFANRGRGHVALRQEIAAQAIANLAGVNAVVLFLCRRDGPQHQGVCYFQRGCMRLEVIVDPAGEHGRFHRRAPRLRECFDPEVKVSACGGKRSFGVHLATAVLYTVTDLSLVNIQADVIHRFHGGASLVFLNQRPLSSAFLHQALLL